MPRNETSMKTIRLLTALILLGTFAVGIAAGAGLYHWVARNPKPPLMGPPRFGPIPLQELKLTAKQDDQIRKIFERHRGELEKVMQGTFPKVRTIIQKINIEIREVLSDEQRAKFDELLEKMPPLPPDAPPCPWSGPHHPEPKPGLRGQQPEPPGRHMPPGPPPHPIAPPESKPDASL